MEVLRRLLSYGFLNYLAMSIVIHTPVNSPEQSYAFYESLGFKQVSDSPRVYTDGKAIIEVNPDRFARPGMKCFKASWQREAEQLRTVTNVVAISNGYLFSDPSNVWIYLIEGEPGYDTTTGEKSFSTLGNYAGLSFETTDVQRSQMIYTILGFTRTSGSAEQGWASFERNGFTISLMAPLCCPHLFFNPSITYFNGGNNLPVIAKIRELNIPITQEIAHFNKEGIVDNIIIRDPGGYGFFVFND